MLIRQCCKRLVMILHRVLVDLFHDLLRPPATVLHHILVRYAECMKDGCVIPPKIMKAEIWYLQCLSEPFKAIGYLVWVQ